MLRVMSVECVHMVRTLTGEPSVAGLQEVLQ